MLEKISNECYRPLAELFGRHRRFRATVNLNGILLDQLEREGERDVVGRFRELVASGQWEIVGSSKDHVILPLVPDDEAARQIELQKESLRAYLGVKEARGFFPPEMCLSPAMLAGLKRAGFEWTLASGTSAPGPWPAEFISKDRATGVRILFRDDVISNRISFDRLKPTDFVSAVRSLKPDAARDAYVITAMDAETYGHHIPNWERDFLQKTFEGIESDPKAPKIRTSTLSDIVDAFGENTVEIIPKASSWSTSHEHERRGVPYPLWHDPENPLHKWQWDHLKLAKALLELGGSVSHLSEKTGRIYGDTRKVMDLAYHSCQFWWASRRPLEGVDLILKGLWLQKEVVVGASRALAAAEGHEPQKAEAARLRREAERIASHIEDYLSVTP